MSIGRIGIVLAAGEGKRLREVWIHPKVLLPIPPSSTLLEQHLNGLRDLGAGTIFIATGYRKGEIENFIKQLDTDVILIEGYLGDTKYGRSLRKVLLEIEQNWGLPKEIFYVMGDHYINYKDLPDFQLKGDLTLAVNIPPFSVDPDTASKVLLDGNSKILKNGKNLDIFSGLDMGLFVINKKVASLVIEFENNSFDTSTIVNKMHLSKLEPYAYTVSNPLWFGCNRPEEVKAGLEKILGMNLSDTEFLDLLRRGENRIKKTKL